MGRIVPVTGQIVLGAAMLPVGAVIGAVEGVFRPCGSPDVVPLLGPVDIHTGLIAGRV